MDETGAVEHLRPYLPTPDYFNQITTDIASGNSKSALSSLDKSQQLLNAIKGELSPATIGWYEQQIKDLRATAFSKLTDAPPRQKFLQFALPDIGDEEIEAVVETLRSGWITTGPKTKKFEEAFARYLGTEATLAVNSCTAAIHLALEAAGIGEGDEVISTPITFCSTIHCIEHVKAKPVLVDVEPDTLNISVEAIAKAITPATKVILPVHYAGHPVDLRPILNLAKQHNLLVIEDAAHAVSTTYEGRRIGTFGDLTAFSFYATKNLVTGEGGMLSGNPELVERARLLSLHGMNRDAWKRYSEAGSWYYEVVEAGFKYNMTDMQAALGLVQLDRLDDMQARRRQIVEMYNAAFEPIAALQVPVEKDIGGHAWHLYVLRLNLDQLTINRAEFIDALRDRKIGSSVHFIPVHLHPFYANKYNWKPEDFPVAYHEYERMLSLPLHSGLTDEDVYDVIAAVLGIVNQSRK